MPRVKSSMATRTMSPPSPMCGPSRATRAQPIPTGRWSRPLNRTERILSAGCALLLLLAACETNPPPPPPDRLTLSPARFVDLPGWSDDRQAEAFTALRRSCRRLNGLGDTAAVGPDAIGGQAKDWREPCAAVTAAPTGDHAA